MSRERQAQLEAQDKRKRERLQYLLWQLEAWMNEEDMQGLSINSIVIRNGRDRGGEVLAVVKATIEGRLWVGFHSATDPEAALTGALERVRNNDLKWREDKPFEK